MQEIFKAPQKILDLINQVFEIEKKAALLKETNSINRNINRIKELIETVLFAQDPMNPLGFIYYNPIGEPYNETRTDCDASISGTSTENLEIIEVIKPIIFLKQGGIKHMVQKAIVIAEAKEN